MYPPIRNVSSQNHQITGHSYGNGLYVTSYSANIVSIDVIPFTCFNTNISNGGSWEFPSVKRYIQPNGTFRTTLTDNIVPGYTGDWLKIKFPVAINLMRYAFKTRSDLPSRSPGNFKIYGSNDEINWIELTHETNAVYVSNSYETTITTSGTYNSFGLVVNELVGNNSGADVLNFDEWFIYGMEKLDPNNYSIVPFHEPINDDYKYIPFVNTGANQTSYNIHFSENTECDILIVGGGGAGGGDQGGGGGAGGLVYLQNQLLTGTYNISVGRGGVGAPVATDDGFNSVFGIYTAVGGGGGGHYIAGDTSKRVGRTGGSGGGGGNIFTTGGDPIGGTTNQLLYNDENGNRQGWGFDGGIGGMSYTGVIPSGGGGGSGEIGENAIGATTAGKGGNGKQINITGSLIYYAGGGGGGSAQNNGSAGGVGGLGGGGHGGLYSTNVPVSSIVLNGSPNALPHTGSGGGGKRAGGTPGGNGGSGIVIIRYKIIKIPFESQWTYNPSNLNVYHLGNVGIGTINPTSALDVLGSVVVNGSISTNSYIASTKTFKIEHPLNINKWLYHGCIEAPRFDNIYRGKKMLINGTCEVDIDSECNTTGGMTAGTFMALNNNFSLHLQNKNSFDGVKGEIIDGKIIISCENIADEIEVEWLVIGERHDEGIVRNNLTNSEGMLICEHEVN
jgi:hypothetical protein